VLAKSAWFGSETPTRPDIWRFWLQVTIEL